MTFAPTTSQENTNNVAAPGGHSSLLGGSCQNAEKYRTV